VLDTSVADAQGQGTVTAELDAYVTTWLRWTVGWNVIVGTSPDGVTLPDIRAEDVPPTPPQFPNIRPSSSVTRYFDLVGVDTFSSAVELGIHLERGSWSVERVIAPRYGDVRVSR
jgi:hypothetical protein